MADSKVLGIIGLGDIGSHCAKVAKLGLDMKVIAVKKDPKSISEA